SANPPPHNSAEAVEAREKARRRRLYQIGYGLDFNALCLSGGGIRSAAISLGVIQALVDKGLLNQFHYLSTVSGGGYIGSWLSAWLHRTDDEAPPNWWTPLLSSGGSGKVSNGPGTASFYG